MVWTLFEYLYRDAGNFKAFGCVALEGRIDADDQERIRAKLESGEHFIAEQVCVPPLYDQLYKWSDGATVSDHCWHEFVGFRESGIYPAECPHGGAAVEFVLRFASVTDWNAPLSPHFNLGS